MGLSGPNPNDKLLVAAMGDGNLIVLGMKNRNLGQNDIIENAHDERIIQIASLSRIQDNYFVTRCSDGDVRIWSASTAHPEPVFPLNNVDQEENASNV